MSNIESLLPHFGEDGRVNVIKPVGSIGAAFAARTTIEVDPQVIAALPQVRNHVLSGGDVELDLAAALDDDEGLAHVILHRAGFKRCPEQWAIGKGNSLVGDYTYPASFADDLTDILDRHEPV